jgi:Zn-dependent protease
MINITDGIIYYLIFLMSTTFHEASHAVFAMWGGDYTAYKGGQVTLDPLPHIKREPMGMVVFPLIFLVTTGYVMGWASAPYDAVWARNNHRRAALMSLAGPMANLTLVIVSGILIKIGLTMGFFSGMDIMFASGTGASAFSIGFAKILKITFYLNLILFVFNLMPLPGFDGSGVISGLFDKNTASKIADVVNNPSYSLISFIIAYNIFPVVFSPVARYAYTILLS